MHQKWTAVPFVDARIVSLSHRQQLNLRNRDRRWMIHPCIFSPKANRPKACGRNQALWFSVKQTRWTQRIGRKPWGEISAKKATLWHKEDQYLHFGTGILLLHQYWVFKKAIANDRMTWICFIYLSTIPRSFTAIRTQMTLDIDIQLLSVSWYQLMR